MFEDLFVLPYKIEMYRKAPLAEHRLRYLRHLKEAGARRSTLLKRANDQLSLVRLLDLREGDRVSVSQIEAATAGLVTTGRAPVSPLGIAQGNNKVYRSRHWMVAISRLAGRGRGGGAAPPWYRYRHLRSVAAQ